MKISILIALVFILAVGASPQDHAVMPEQCRADVRVWYSQTKEDTAKISFDELQRRSLELWNCQSVDTGAGEPASDLKSDMYKYQLIWMTYTNLSGQRMQHFLERHGLAKQFKEEDAAGQR
jgi:hypothetical protein